MIKRILSVLICGAIFTSFAGCQNTSKINASSFESDAITTEENSTSVTLESESVKSVSDEISTATSSESIEFSTNSNSGKPVSSNTNQTPTKPNISSSKPTPNTSSSKPAPTSSQPPQTSSKEESKTPVSSETTGIPFDIEYWIQYAKDYGVGIGLKLDETTTGCWDTPMTASKTSKYLERDIKDRLNGYKNVEHFEYFWVWAELRNDGKYDIFIGYA